MEFAPINMAHGNLGTTGNTPVFTVPADGIAIMRSVVLVNRNNSEVTVNCTIQFGGAGTAVYLIPPNFRLLPYCKYDDNSVVNLPANTVVSLQASAANAVDFIVSGVITTNA